LAGHPDLEAEQAYIDRAYACLEATRLAASRMTSMVEVGRGGTEQARFERDVIWDTMLQRLSQLQLGDASLIFGRIDGHISVANSAALKVAGIDLNTKAPSGGQIDRDANGEATGILRESAVALVGAKIPRPTPSQVRQAMELALADAAQWGLTSVQSQMLDNREWEDFLVCEDLEREGKLTTRVNM